MAVGTRTVRHLRLRAGDAADVRRGAVLLEDALRTASLPDSAGRILAVRRLDLGTIDPRAPPQTLALRLERGLAQLTAAAVHGAAPAAASAAAVWFADALEAHTVLALRIACGETADAWYWPLALPTCQAHLPARQQLRRLALSLVALPEAPAALPRWTDALVRAGHRRLLAASLDDQDIEVIARAVHLPILTRVAAPEVRAARTAADALIAALLRSLPARADSVSAPDDPVMPAPLPACEARADAARLITAGVRPLAPATEREAAMSAAPAIRPSDRIPDGQTRPTAVPGPTLPAPGDAPADARHHHGGGGRVPPDSGHAPSLNRAGRAALGTHPASLDVGRRELVRREAEPTALPQAAVPWPAPSRSAAGGLLFLVPVLRHLGYDEWLDDQPDWARWDVAQRMFSLLLERLGVPADDPAWLLAATGAPRAAAPGRFVAPACWRDAPLAGRGQLLRVGDPQAGGLFDPAGRLLLARWRGSRPRSLMPLLRQAQPALGIVPPGDEPIAAAWLVACRRWLRRFANMALANLVLRSGGLALTPTHADLFFGHDQAEMRIRRSGLDLDPGWVPWLRRVVGFHYDNRGGR